MPRRPSPTVALERESPSRRPRTLPPGESPIARGKRIARWNREYSEWLSFLTGQGCPAGQIPAIILDALGPNPVEPPVIEASPPPTPPVAAVGSRVSSTRGPTFRWGDRVPLPPVVNHPQEAGWPHPLERKG